MKAYWIAAGLGTLAAIVGGVMWSMSNEKYGVIVFLSGITVAVMALVFRLLTAFIDERARQKNRASS